MENKELREGIEKKVSEGFVKETTLPPGVLIRYITTQILTEVKKQGYVRVEDIEVCPECDGLKVIVSGILIDNVYEDNCTVDCSNCKGRGFIVNS